MLKDVCSCLSLLCLFVLPSFAYTIKPITSDKFPAAGDTVYFNIIKDNGDVDVVDVILVDTQGNGNLTTILSPFNTQTNSNQGFIIPKSVSAGTYLIRFVDNSSKKFIIDSATFQIFAAGTSSASSTSNKASSTSSGPSSTSSPGNSNDPSTTKGKKSNVGPIVGGVVGGLVVVAIIILLLFWRRKRNNKRQNGDEDFGNEKRIPFAPPSTSSNAAKVEPFRVVPHPTLPDMHNDHDTQVSSLTLGSGVTGAVTNGKGGYLADAYRPLMNVVDSSSVSMLPSSDGSVSGSTTGAARAEHLRRERERISREIAALENSASSTTGSSLPSNSGLSTLAPGDSASAVSGVRDREFSSQLLRLQEQIRQIEARQAFSAEAAEDFSIPPPMYDGPSAPAPHPAFPTPQIETDDQPARVDHGTRALPNPTTNAPPPDVKTAF